MITTSATQTLLLLSPRRNPGITTTRLAESTATTPTSAVRGSRGTLATAVMSATLTTHSKVRPHRLTVSRRSSMDLRYEEPLVRQIKATTTLALKVRIDP